MSSESDNQYGTESDESQESGEEYGGTANATKERQNGHVPLALVVHPVEGFHSGQNQVINKMGAQTLR